MYGLNDYLANPTLMQQMQQVQPMQVAYNQVQAPPVQQAEKQSPMAMGQQMGGLMGKLGGPAAVGKAPAGATQAVGQGMGAFRPEALASAAPAAGAGGAAQGGIMAMLSNPAALSSLSAAV